MNKLTYIMVGFVSLVTSYLSRVYLENQRIVGIRLSVGWLNDYGKTDYWGFPFATFQSPPANCFCVIDTNPIAAFLNTIIIAIIIFFATTIVIKTWTSAKFTPTA